MTPLTLTNVRDHAGFVAYCAQNCARLSEAEHQCKDAAEKATKLQAICDTAFVTRDASQTQANEIAAHLTGMRTDHLGDGATRLFDDVLDAGGLEEKVTLATVRAREAGVLAVLAGALEYHRGHRYPRLHVLFYQFGGSSNSWSAGGAGSGDGRRWRCLAVEKLSS